MGCEYSGTVREAFRKLGHDAWSNDLLDADDGSPFHYKGDLLELLATERFDLGIFHVPCTHLAVSGARHFKAKQEDGRQGEGLNFAFEVMATNLPRWAVENPVSIISTQITKSDQTVQPWMFGHKENKATCLWLHRLPKLVPTNIVGPMPKDASPEERKEWNRMHLMPPGPNRWKERSKTYQGLADAMAEQDLSRSGGRDGGAMGMPS